MSFWSARVLSCAVILGVCAALSPPPARAAEKTAALVPAVLTVDLAQVLRGSKAGKGVQTALSQESTNYSKEVARQEDELQRMRSDLEPSARSYLRRRSMPRPRHSRAISRNSMPPSKPSARQCRRP